jgi:hypothetical protein
MIGWLKRWWRGQKIETRSKAYDDHACPRCGNFTLIAHGNAAICDSCQLGFVK